MKREVALDHFIDSLRTAIFLCSRVEWKCFFKDGLGKYGRLRRRYGGSTNRKQAWREGGFRTLI